MKTAILNGHVHETPARELTGAELIDTSVELLDIGILLVAVIDVFHHVHLWAMRPTTTVQEVIALRAFAAVTDARLVWHGLVAS